MSGRPQIEWLQKLLLAAKLPERGITWQTFKNQYKVCRETKEWRFWLWQWSCVRLSSSALNNWPKVRNFTVCKFFVVKTHCALCYKNLASINILSKAIWATHTTGSSMGWRFCCHYSNHSSSWGNHWEGVIIHSSPLLFLVRSCMSPLTLHKSAHALLSKMIV